MGISELLVALLVIFAAAKVFGELAERIGQPAVLGEMIGGIVIGVSGLHLIDAHNAVLHVLAELGVVLLLFLIGLETDIQRLLSVGGTSAAVAAGVKMTAFGVTKIFAVAFGFVVLALVIGSLLAPRLVALVARVRVGKALFFASIMFAFALAYLADLAGSALIIGAFAAGLVLAKTDRGRDIEHEVYDVAQFFIPIFFVSVGAAVDLKALNPFSATTRPFFIIGILLTIVAIAGKLLAGYAAFGRPMRKLVIGVGMIPRGEVGLIFAQLGLSSKLLSTGLYTSVALMVMITTFVAPPALRALLAKTPREDYDSALCDVVTEAFSDNEDAETEPR